MKTRSAKLLLGGTLAACLVHLSGCVGYQLGSTLPPDLRTVHVPTFINKTKEPMLETDVTRAVIQELQRDGTLLVVGKTQADTILKVVLSDYERDDLRSEKNSRRTTREYRIVITAEITFERARTHEVLLQRKVQGEATFYPGGDMNTTERLAVPTAARDLAHDIVESVVEYW